MNALNTNIKRTSPRDRRSGNPISVKETALKIY
jgi:hypothetical protein